MKIHEYQAKAVFAEFGVPVPKGRVAKDAAEAKAIAQELGGKVVVKAQIHAGGRGKGGGVKLANSPDEAAQVATQILGMQLVTHQTGPEGQKVKTRARRGADADRARAVPRGAHRRRRRHARS